MKRFSFKAFLAIAFLHLAGTIWLTSATISRVHAFDSGEIFPWMTILSWIWMPVSFLLSYHFHFGRSRYFYYLALRWSLLVALCCGFAVPYFSRVATPSGLTNR
jgi:hypothetical protein